MKLNYSFTCLGSIINHMLVDDAGKESRASKQIQCMGVLSFMWNDINGPLSTKEKLNSVVPLNLLFRGEENWNRSTDSVEKIDFSPQINKDNLEITSFPTHDLRRSKINENSSNIKGKSHQAIKLDRSIIKE